MNNSMEHADVNDKENLDPNLPPLTKWERIEKTSEVFPLNNGHRGQIVNNNLLVYGGFSGLYTNKIYKLNLDALEWHPSYHEDALLLYPPEFAGRQWHSLVKYNNNLYTYGGATDLEPHQFGDVFEYDPATCRWQEIKFVTNEDHALVPAARYVHSALVYKNGMYIYGGKSDVNNVANTFGDLWRFDLDTRKWTLLKPTGDIPPARRAHMAALFENKMFVFGGWNGTDHYNDMYYYHLKKNYWRLVKQNGDVPPPTQLHTSVVRGGIMYMVAGKVSNPEKPLDVYTGDLYEFRFSTSTWKKIDVVGSESVARGGQLTCEYNNYLYMLGGYDGLRMSSLWRLKLPEAEIHEWIKNLSARLKSDMRTIYRLKQYSDLDLQIDGQTYHLHSALLSARCSALLTWIQSGKIQTENLSKKQMEILIEYIYEDEFKNRPIYISEMANMHDLAIKLDLPYLARLIEQAVADILDPENLFEAVSTFTTPFVQKRIREIYTAIEPYCQNLNFTVDAIMEVNNVPVAPRGSFSENLLELLRTGAHSDVTITINEEQFKLHQVILHQRCPYFKGFSEFNQRTSGSGLVHKPHMPITAFKSLLKYVYGAKISCEHVGDYFWLLQEGSFYMIDDKYFYKKIAQRITKQCTLDTANTLLDMANKFSFNGIEEIKQVIRSVMK